MRKQRDPNPASRDRSRNRAFTEGDTALSEISHPSDIEVTRNTPQETPGPSRSRWRRLSGMLARLLRILVVCYVGALAVLYALQTRMIFPGAVTQGQPSAQVTPGAGCELVPLTTPEGERVIGLYGPATPGRGLPDSSATSHPTAIFFYGNGMCLSEFELQFNQFRRLGLNVFVPDYVGYGLSSGSPSEKACQATADAAYDYIVLTRKVDPAKVVATGWSLGGAVAIDLASRRQVGGLIVFSTFTSMTEMARRILPFVPVSLLLRHRFDSVHKIPAIRCPTLIGHGRRDGVVPFFMGEKLAAAAGGPLSTLWIDEADHGDFFHVGGRQVDAAVSAFLKQHFAMTPGT